MRGHTNLRALFAGLLLLFLFSLAVLLPESETPPPEPDVETREEADVPPSPEPVVLAAPAPGVRQHVFPPIRIHGRVLSASSGEAVAGARIVVRRPSGEWRTATDASGDWTLSVPPSSWVRGERTPWVPDWPVLHVEAEGFIGLRRGIRFTGADDPWRAPTISLTPIGATVTVRVRDPEGEPVVGAMVGFTGAPGGVTDDRGRLGPCPVPPGALRVEARAFGFWPVHRRLLVRADSEEFALELVLGRMERVNGRIVDETGDPVPGAQLTAGYAGPVVETADAEGRFQWPLEPGETGKVHAKMDGYVDMELGQDVSLGGENRIVLHRAGAVEGRVLRADGSPAAGFVAYAQFELFAGHSRLTDAQGRFRIDRIRLGDLNVLVKKHGIVLARFPATVPGPDGGVTLRLPPLESTTVALVDAVTGQPVSGAALVGINSSDIAWSDDSGRARLLHAESEPGAATICITHPLYRRQMLPVSRLCEADEVAVQLIPQAEVHVSVVMPDGTPASGALVKYHGDWPWMSRGETCDVEGRQVLKMRSTRSPQGLQVIHPLGVARVQVRADAATRDVRIVLGPGKRRGRLASIDPAATGVLEGLVTDPDGRPVPGAAVGAAGTRIEVPVDGRGRFRFDGLPAGWEGLLEVLIPGFHDPVAHRLASTHEAEPRITVPGRATVRIEFPDDRDGDETSLEAWLLERPDLERGGVLRMGSSTRFVGKIATHIVPSGKLLLRGESEGLWPVWHVDLTPGEVVDLSWSRPRRTPLRVTVLGSDGRPATDVRIEHALTGWRVAASVEDGSVRMRHDSEHLGVGALSVWGHANAPHLTRPVDLGRGEVLPVHLSRPGHVRIEVRDPAGEPLSRRVRLRRPVGRHDRWRTTGPDGNTTFYGVPPGRQSVEISIPNRYAQVREVEIIEDEKVTLRVTVPGN